jgi:hypothetical protein
MQVWNPKIFLEMNPASGSTMLQFPTAISVFLLVAIGFILLSAFAPRSSEKFFRSLETIFAKLAERKTLAIALLFFAVIAIRLAVLPLLPVPIPGIHDEFSYLLMGDTFAHSRLANPTHPMWMSFETFHVNWIPTYSSKYPPAQGLVLAVGYLLGLPWIGVLLSNAAMAAAILWMLQAWLPARWALLGGVLVALKLGIAGYWMNSYWGGAVAAAGGALVLGALPRIVRQPRTRDALLLGVGIALLANSRPYEGLLLCIPVACWFLWWLAGKTRSNAAMRARAQNVLVPLTAFLTLTIAFMGYYNWRLTGTAAIFPYALNARTYESAGLFLWDHPREPLHYNNQQFEEFYNGWELENYNNSWQSVWKVTAEKLTRSGSTYFWWGALLLLPGLPFVFFDRKMRLPLAVFLIVTAGFFSVMWSMPHYAAPLTCVIFLLLVQAIRHLRTMRVQKRPIGAALSRAVVVLLAVDTVLGIAQGVCDPLKWTCQGDPSRVAVAEKLSHTPGKHLILVRYGEGYNVHDDWVFNGAEIDGAKVLWARETNPRQNAKLLAYFKDRQIWLIEPEEDSTELIPYPLAVAPPEH